MTKRSTNAARGTLQDQPLYRAPSGVGRYSVEEIESQYDIEASVPDYESYGRYFTVQSKQARQELTCELGLSYGQSAQEFVDVFPGSNNGPLVVFVHGGYWRALTSREFSFVARGLVERGATVVVPTYDLCPHVTIDEITRQVRAAIAWAARADRAHRWGCDPHELVVVGHSAGAHAAVMAIDTNWAHYGLKTDPIAAVCAISGLYDLRPLVHTQLQPTLRLTAETVLSHSPILRVPESPASLLITYGLDQTDEFLRQSIDFADACDTAGLTVELWPRPNLNHFDELQALEDPGSDLVERIMMLRCRY